MHSSTVGLARLALLAASCALIAGCAIGLLDAAPRPMRWEPHFADPARASRCLIVFLPGVLDNASAFEKNGFIDALATRHLAVDWITAQATIGYYSRHEVAERIREDVLAPMASRAYQIWLVGVSMGGFGAVLVGADEGSRIAGMLLLAPFLGDLGDHGLLTEIDKAGGLFKWDGVHVANEDDQRDGWRFLKRVAEHPEGPPVVYLASAHKDPLNYGHRLLGEALPKERVLAIPGNHEWQTWETLWIKFLDETDFRARCGL
jgi:pimeloyl-ACP methyl ester carboxylesterase